MTKMTFYVEFYAEQAFLAFVKSQITKESKFDLEEGAVRTLSWQSRTKDSLGSQVIGRYGYCAGLVFQKAYWNGGYLGM